MKQKLILFLLILSLPLSALAHSGGTDSNGGHYDRSTGQYHYHHGYSAHQHPNGVCPYEKKETVTKGTTYSNSIVSQPTSTPKRLIVITARPTKPPLRASSTATPRPSATSKVRPAVTVAPGSKVTSTATPRLTPTPMITATPRITTTPRVTATPRNTSNTTAPLYVADEMSHVWNYLLLGGAAFVSLCVAIASYQSKKREHVESTAYIEELRRRLSTSSIKKNDEEKELQIAYAEMAKLEQKLNDANKRIEKLINELEFAPIPPPAPLPKPIPAPVIPAVPKPAPVLPPAFHATAGDISPKTLYMIKYPRSWTFIKNNALVPDSYVNYYHSVWGRLQAYHGDGIVFDTLTDDEQSFVDYPPVGKSVYLASADADTYHSTPNCYTLLKSTFIEVDSSLTIVYKRCTKCVPPRK